MIDHFYVHFYSIFVYWAFYYKIYINEFKVLKLEFKNWEKDSLLAKNVLTSRVINRVHKFILWQVHWNLIPGVSMHQGLKAYILFLQRLEFQWLVIALIHLRLMQEWNGVVGFARFYKAAHWHEELWFGVIIIVEMVWFTELLIC